MNNEKIDRGAYLPDNSRATQLGDGRFIAAVAINGQGHETLWLYDEEFDGMTTYDYPSHERTGKLPADVRRALGLVCGAPTNSRRGTCAMPVDAFGARCSHHPPEADESEPTNAR